MFNIQIHQCGMCCNIPSSSVVTLEQRLYDPNPAIVLALTWTEYIVCGFKHVSFHEVGYCAMPTTDGCPPLGVQLTS